MAQTKEGAIKIAAKKADMTVAMYLEYISNGMKKCTICKTWKEIEYFSKDKTRHDGLSSRCKTCGRAIWRIKNIVGPKRQNRRDGDKVQARGRINMDITNGLRPDPDILYCSTCGHKGKDRRHEYHHILGYEVEHHYDVLPLCSRCHATFRKKDKSEAIWTPRLNGQQK